MPSVPVSKMSGVPVSMMLTASSPSAPGLPCAPVSPFSPFICPLLTQQSVPAVHIYPSPSTYPSPLFACHTFHVGVSVMHCATEGAAASVPEAFCAAGMSEDESSRIMSPTANDEELAAV